ncbi:MAG: hypothetical protein GF344_14610 [Chitinivibrionales bacterium]|nr:hypothetical protein [Chitinivibrionales bacterium]MBD3357952.1 hypothetical protein [Chitinivibrionales bacterium]
MRTITFVIALTTCIHASNFEELLRLVDKEYTRKQTEYNEMARAKRYHWEILTINEYPLWCNEDATSGIDGEAVWVDGFGKVLLEDKNGVYVAVRSWIDRKKDDQAQVIRVFQYRKSRYGVWQRIETIKITQVWDQSCGWVCQR